MLDGFANPGRIALIGASSDIGMAIVSQLPSNSARETVLVGRSGEYALDVTDKAERNRVISQLFDSGDLDLVIIAVGLQGNDPARSESENLLDAIEVNYTGTVHLIELIAQRMQVQAHGTILVISSFAQVRPRVDNYGYGSTKAALDFYARGLAEKIRGTGVSIKILRPGFVKSKMTTGIPIAPFAITVQDCGDYGVKALSSKKVVTWAPSFLKYVALIFVVLPTPIFRKITAR